MKISAQEEYGLRCLLRVAKAGEGQSLTLPEVAAAEGLSIPYVAKLLSVLRQAGVIDSARGRSGGYRLAKAPAEIGLGSVLLTLGEPLFDEEGYCERHAGSAANGSCVHTGSCNLRGLWQTLEHWLRQALDQITLADLCRNGLQIGDLVRDRLAQSALDPHPVLLTLNTSRQAGRAAAEPVSSCAPVGPAGSAHGE